ncbi:STAS domain-containing protein [Pimelobacter simplex]|uniref:STAS domain-containing protein n=1 Tax=Nocardioides simplex TaxID=2045 RepID=UPI00366D1013
MTTDPTRHLRPPADCSVATGIRDAVAEIAVVGDLVVSTTGLLEAAVTHCLHERPLRVRVDLHAVRFMDCAALTTLLECRARTRAQGALLTVIHPSPAVTRLLDPATRLALGVGVGVGQDRTRLLECLACAALTEHVPGETTVGPDGSVLVQWWRCTRCPEGNAVG